MAEFTHTAAGALEVGFKEDYSEIMKDISPTKTPIWNMLGSEKVDAAMYETYTEDLYALDGEATNARAQGVVTTDVTKKDEDQIYMYNYTQIYFDWVQAAKTAREAKQVGINDVLKHKAFRLLIHLKQNAEARMLTGVKKKAPKASTTGGYMAGIPGIISNYGEVANGGTNFGNSSENVDITLDDFALASPDAQTAFDTALRERWEDGGEPDLCVMSGANKVNVAAWDSSGVTRNLDDPRRVIYNVEFYESALGVPVAMVPHRAFSAYTNVTGDDFDTSAQSVITDFAILFDPKYYKTCTMVDDGWETGTSPVDGRLFKQWVTAQVGLRCYNPGGDMLFSFSGYTGYSVSSSLPSTSAAHDAT